jgi:uncharacterized protein with ParB-like and HNH nuclease domain
VKVDKLNLERVFERTERLEAPLFQRPYVWKQEPNWKALWESIEMVAERRLEGRLIHPHFLGTIVLDQLSTGLGKIHVRQIIDGQQRLTTLQLALAAARDLCTRLSEGRYAKAFEKLTVNEVPLSDDPDDLFKVWPTNADQDDFRDVMKAGAPALVRKMEHASTDDNWLIPNAYLYFCDTFDEWLGPAGTEEFRKRLDALYSTMRDDLHLVIIDLEANDDAQEIFETLNSLGTPLLPADLVKNFLFHRAELENEDTRKLYGLHWKKFDAEKGYWRKEVRQGRLKRPRLDLFLGHFLTLQRREEVIIAQLFSAYRDLIRESNGANAAAHMKHFSSYADVYESFEQFAPESREGLFFYRLEQLDTTTVFPLLLEVVNRYNVPDRRGDFHQILNDVESFFVRRVVCELTAKNYNKLVIELLRELHNADDFSASAIRRFLLKQESDISRWPSDDEFKKAWDELLFYKKLKKKARMILEALEVALHTGKTEKVTIESTLTMEHLMPREWERHWPLSAADGTPEADEQTEHRDKLLHTIGNLTLLTKELNPSVSNGPWDRKLEAILKHSALNLNRSLAKRWDEAAIQARTEALFKTAVKIWPRPSA